MLGKSEGTLFLMKFQTTSERTKSFVHFITDLFLNKAQFDAGFL